jgi:hypothetical protein
MYWPRIISTYILTQYVHPAVKSDLSDLLRKLASRAQNQGLAVAILGVDLLQHAEAQGGRFTGSGLRLRNDIATLRDWHDGSLLNSRRLLKLWPNR